MSGENDPRAEPPAWWIEAQNQERLQRERERSQQRLFEYFELQRKEWNAELLAKRQAEANQSPTQPALSRSDPAREAIILAIDILRNELGREPHRSEVYTFLADGRDPDENIIKSDPHVGLKWYDRRANLKLMTKKQFNARYKALTKDD